MLSPTRHQLSLPARLGAMPDYFDRARLASVAVLGGFAALALALIGFLVFVPEGPLSQGGSDLGQVLTTAADRRSSEEVLVATSPGRPSASGSATVGAVGGGSGGDGAGAGGGNENRGGPGGNASQPDGGGGFPDPQLVPISVSSSGTGEPSGAPQSPSAPAQPASSPTPSDTPVGSGGGGEEESPPQPSAPGSQPNGGQVPAGGNGAEESQSQSQTAGRSHRTYNAPSSPVSKVVGSASAKPAIPTAGKSTSSSAGKAASSTSSSKTSSSGKTSSTAGS